MPVAWFRKEKDREFAGWQHTGHFFVWQDVRLTFSNVVIGD
jgi:hypothetical protein